MLKEDMKQSSEEGFNKFMELPATRLMLSSIPPAPVPETLETLLKTAYESGYAGGAVFVLIPLLRVSFSRGRT
jgi:hypothetical protein